MIQIDMKMPKNCKECRFSHGTFCVACNDSLPNDYMSCCGADRQIPNRFFWESCRPDWCPLREVEEIIVPEGYKPWRLGVDNNE